MTCRSCGAATTEALTLGNQVPANRYLAPADFDKPEPRYDLTVMLCGACGLAQLRTAPPPEEMFSRYSFRTSHAIPLRKHFAHLAEAYGGPGKVIVEVGSNDGALGAYLRDTGVDYTGVDPAANLAAIANAEGHRTIVGFFGSGAERDCPKADVVIARNVFAHVPDQRGFIRAVDSILKPDGVFVIEAPWVAAMFQEADALNIYHEHAIYLGIASLRGLLHGMGFHIAAANPVPLYGGSLLYEVRRGSEASGPGVDDLEAVEWKRGCYSVEGWTVMMAGATMLRDRFKRNLEARHRKVAGYCASAKGSVLLQWAGIGKDLLPFVADTTSLKMGLVTPGSHIPIVHPEALRKWDGEWLAVLSANWFDAIRDDPTLRHFRLMSTDGREG